VILTFRCQRTYAGIKQEIKPLKGLKSGLLLLVSVSSSALLALMRSYLMSFSFFTTRHNASNFFG